MKQRLFISFSGGRTSAFMTWLLLRSLDPAAWDIVILFANTGEEDPETLKFVDRCDRLLFQPLGHRVIWIEAITNPQQGIGVRANVVTFETASRNGEPFKAMIAKHGIPNQNFNNCTKETKVRPMRAYIRDVLKWKLGTYQTAIGLRADEIDRMSVSAAKDRVWYPLITLGVDKSQVVAWWREQSFDLYLPEHRGNCVTCWKKSLRKHLTLMVEDPLAFAFNREMELKYAFTGPGQTGEPRRFFRGNKTVNDLIELAQQPFNLFVDGDQAFDPDLDVGGGCEESCEVDHYLFESDDDDQ